MLGCGRTLAHPHVWVDFASEIVFDDKNRIAAIRHHWRFDKEFSAYALQGLDGNRDGHYSAEELEPLARENVESLKDFDYFTFLSVGDYLAGFAAPSGYHLELSDGRLLLHFTLPLAIPLLTRGTARLEVYDPEYYVAFSLPSIEAVRLAGAPATCRLSVHPARELDPAAAAALSAIGPDQRELPPEMQSLTEGVENSAEVACGAAPPATAADAVADLGADADLAALPAASSDADAASAEPAQPRSSRTGIVQRWMAWIGAQQTRFNRDLTAALESFREGGAFWWLGGISFLYGIVHAAGPGHGKVVISSYLIASEARIRRGVAIAFLAAFVQACVAVGLIGLMAVALNMTSMAIDSTARVFEAGSFALVALLGFYLLARKGRAMWAMAKGGDAHAHHHHHHQNHHHTGDSLPPCGGEMERGEGHSLNLHRSPLPIPPPEGGRGGALSAAAAVLSVGIRPCTGALVVLVFALSQGVFWAGAASTFVMALGTAIAVAVLAALAVGAKGLAARLAQHDGRRAGQVMLGVELFAALAIAALGTSLFFGTVYS